MDDPEKLRELASWYREFAERAGNPVIWEGRLRMAEDLDEEARRIEQRETMRWRGRRKLQLSHGRPPCRPAPTPAVTG